MCVYIDFHHRLRIVIVLNCYQVVDARGGPSLKTTVKSKKVKSLSRRIRPNQLSRIQKELKRHSEPKITYFNYKTT